ncbi:GNAT family N-acetyltransferase [uncultured Cohaesibacter sp.]|uniref:GNAT family N-acetyltransferase n=1 Tax=uncultured Cohaesibacter sp. TaxID=1002546 RepID=UPI00292F57A4|nr:GNAT family N-acetyltransferase [uncultured Cohaesibacter sp.]
MSSKLLSTDEIARAAVQLRMANARDVEAIHRMVAGIAAHLGEAHKHKASAEDYLQYGFCEAPRFECVLAELDGEPVGMCLFFDSFSTWMGKPGLYVQDLFVAPEARGLKLGRRLMAYVARLGKDRGCAYVRLSVDADNVSAQKFYEACGLCWSQSEKLYVARDDAFLALAGEGDDASC